MLERHLAECYYYDDYHYFDFLDHYDYRDP